MSELVERVLRDSEALRRAAREFSTDYQQLLLEVWRAGEPLRKEAVRERLRAVPVARLRQVADGPFRLGPVQGAELVSVADILDSTPDALQLLRGVGPATAERLHTAAARLADAANRPPGLSIEIGRRDEVTMPLLAVLHRLVNASPDLPRARAFAERVNHIRFSADLDELRRALGWRRVFLKRWRQIQAVEEFVVRKDLLEELDGTPLTLPDLLGPRVPEDEAWRDFERRPDDYHAVLADAAGLTAVGKAARGFLGDELAARVEEQPLDLARLRVSLRDFESFGARFALVQRRAILGDEMGLGRSIQAIAAIAHRRAEGATHFLVACPASVLLNWVRDIETCSSIDAHLLHGPDRHAVKKRWIEFGGVAVVPLEALADHEISRDVAVGMFVVDEAHRLKNPGTARARAVAAWGDRVDAVLFLTGMPMEDRVQEFRTLVALLGSRAEIRPENAVLGPLAFRAAVAPVYLRRTQRDVLAELPDIVHVDELVAFSRADSAAYRNAVMSGDFGGMRRAAYAVPTTSAKLRRLRRLVEEAAGEERKVVVLSAFGEVLDTVRDALGTLAPVTAGTPADRRREIVDAFAAAPGHAVLPAEIGVGDLNPRGASMVIVCEPHPDRDLERRAIGHVHGAGPTGPLLVHRLVAPGSLDERVADDPASIIEDEQAAASSPPGS